MVSTKARVRRKHLHTGGAPGENPFTFRSFAKSTPGQSAGDRALIDAAIAAGRVTYCPPFTLSDGYNIKDGTQL